MHFVLRFLFPVALAVAGTTHAAETLRVTSFNVRNSNAADGVDAWPGRTALFFDTITAFGPDPIGFQEVLALQHDAITARLSDYTFSGVARDDGKRKGEWSLIAYRRARFAAVAQGDFCFPETPDPIGSKSWDAAIMRICSWVRRRETATGREFVFANTHFNHKGVVARQEASRLISTRLAQIAAHLPTLLAGDLNITEDNPAHAMHVRPTAPGAIR